MFPLLLDTIQRDSVISFPFAGGLTVNPPASFFLFGREIYLYGVIVAAAFLCGILYCARHAPEFGIASDSIYDLVLWLIPLSLLGARLYYVLFQADYYFAHPGEILAVWEGGLAIYGGIIAGVIVTVVFCRRKKLCLPAMLDAMSFGILIGQAIGRWGNFFNREAFGAETAVFCRMGLTAPDGNTIYVHPTFLYESLWNISGFLLLRLISRRGWRRYDGQFVLFYFLWYGLGRSWIEGLRTDSLYLWNTGIRVSQALSILLALVSGTLLLLNMNRHDLRTEPGSTPEPGGSAVSEADLTHNKSLYDESTEKGEKDV